jgi:hypothetical protein
MIWVSRTWVERGSMKLRMAASSTHTTSDPTTTEHADHDHGDGTFPSTSAEPYKAITRRP